MRYRLRGETEVEAARFPGLETDQLPGFGDKLKVFLRETGLQVSFWHTSTLEICFQIKEIREDLPPYIIEPGDYAVKGKHGEWATVGREKFEAMYEPADQKEGA